MSEPSARPRSDRSAPRRSAGIAPRRSPRGWVEDGTRDGPLVVLVNSLGSTLEIWAPVLETLGRDHRLVRFDLRGHGRAPAVPGPYEIADLGRDLVALLDALDAPSASVCGISIGGMGAIWLAAHAPERVDRLVVGCTSARLGPPEAWAERAGIVRRAGMEGVADMVARRWVTPGWGSAHPDGLARLHEMIASCEPEGYASWCGAIERMDLRPELPSIAAPTLVLGGAEDRAIPVADLRELADGIAGARLEMVPGAAHIPMIEAPAVVGARILEHLGAPGGGSR